MEGNITITLCVAHEEQGNCGLHRGREEGGGGQESNIEEVLAGRLRLTNTSKHAWPLLMCKRQRPFCMALHCTLGWGGLRPSMHCSPNGPRRWHHLPKLLLYIPVQLLIFFDFLLGLGIMGGWWGCWWGG